jgi:hypothetical protein
MSRPTTLIRIFLASPGDVQSEREIARHVITEVNRSVAIPRGFALQAVGWETDAIPELSGDPQSVVNAQILDSEPYDLFVGIMWNRFGTATGRADSGTEEEFNHSFESWKNSGRPHIMFYFCTRPSSLDRVDEVEQRKKVIQFKSKIQNLGLIFTFSATTDFERLFREHLTRWIGDLESAKPPAQKLVAAVPQIPLSAPVSTSAPGPAPNQWLLLKDRFFLFDTAQEDHNGNLTITLPQPPPEDEALLRSFQNANSRWGREAVPFAMDLDGGNAAVTKAERSSKGGITSWTLELKIDRDRQSSAFEFGINNLTADQIAEKRGRMMLLGEDPGVQDSVISSMVMGNRSTSESKTNIFLPLWTRFSENPALFPEFARLWGVYQLKTTLTVEHVFELKVSITRKNMIHLRFRGERRQMYTNKPPVQIEIEGDCAMG